MTTTVEVFVPESGTFEEIDYNSAQISRGIGSVRVAPSATVRTSRRTITAGQDLRITIDGSVEFEGSVVDPKRQGSGQLKIEAENDAVDVFESAVSLDLSSPTDADVLSAALSNAAGVSLTLDYVPTPISLGDDYSVEDRTVRRVFQDIMDRGGRVFRVSGTTVHVENLGGRGEWQTIDTGAQTGGARVREYSPGSKQTVRNRVKVNGTAGERVVGTADDSASISEFGEQFDEVNVSYIASSAEADAYASELLIPEPLSQAKLAATTAVGDVVSSRVNQTVTITDESTGIDGETFVIEGHTLEPQQAVFDVGEGAGVDIEATNRASKSATDETEPGTVFGNDRLANDSVDTEQLVDTAVIESKLDDLSVSLNKIDFDAIDETKIQDDAVETPKLAANAVAAEKIDTDLARANRLLAGTIEAVDIATDTLTANEIDTLDLDAGELTVSNDPDNPTNGVTFDFDNTSNIVSILPINDEEARIGELGGDRFIGVHASVITGDTYLVDTSLRPSGAGAGVAELGGSSFYWDHTYTESITFGDPADPQIRNESGVTGTELIPTTDGDCKVGNGNFQFDEIHAEAFFSDGSEITGGGGGSTFDTISVDTIEENQTSSINIQPTWSSPYIEIVESPTVSGQGLIQPTQGNTWAVGSSTNYFSGMNAESFNTQSPVPTDGFGFDDILGYDWYSPPAYATLKSSGGETHYQNPDKTGIDLGHMTNYLFEVTKSQSETIQTQQERIDDLEATVADLEARLSDLESGANT